MQRLSIALLGLTSALAWAGCVVEQVTTDSGTPADGSSPALGDASQIEGSSGGDAASSAESGSDGPASIDGDGGSSHDSASTPETSDEPAPFVVAPHPAWPTMPLMAPGIILKPMKLVSIVVQGETLSNKLFAFGDALVAGSWWTTVGKDYSLGTPTTPTVHVTGPAIPQNTSRTDPQNPGRMDMENYILGLIQAGTAPPADDKTMYMLYLPPGVVAFDDASGTSNSTCQFYAGYHSAIDSVMLPDGGVTGIAWGFAQRCGNASPLSEQDTLTVTASHEIVEAATDPIPGYGWGFQAPGPPSTTPWTDTPYSVLGGEDGDLCEDTQWSDGTYLYQRIWSVSAAMQTGDPCVPAYPNIAYVNASVAPNPAAQDAGISSGWYAVSPGQSVSIAITGFSDRRAPDWFVYAVPAAGTDANMELTITVTAATTVQTNAGPTATINDGRTATFTVKAAAGIASGTWAMFEIVSQPQMPNGGDTSHFWPLGIYVP